MKFHILTLFPEMVTEGLCTSVIGKAIERKLIEMNAVNIRDYTMDKHGSVDDYPYGGGAGMLMQAQPVFDAYLAVSEGKKLRTIYVTPQGVPFTQKLAEELSREQELIFLCGHYEGIDERVLEEIVTDRISIGDYVLTGGELPAMVMVDAISRLVPGVLGNEASSEKESFFNDLLEYPQYSRPEEWRGHKVPAVLLSGDHKKIDAWRLEQSKERTAKYRPDLFEKYERREHIIEKLSREKRNNIHLMETLSRGKGEILWAEDGGLLLYQREHGICMISVMEEQVGERLCSLIPDSCRQVLVSREFMKNMLCDRHGFFMFCPCEQLCYTQREPLPVRYRDIRALTLEDAEYVLAHWQIPADICGGCENIGKTDLEKRRNSYITERIRSGSMYGAFLEGRLIGFAGIHANGSVGMLFVEEDCRNRKVGAALEAYLINKEREAGHIPYVHVPMNNEAALKLQEYLGLYKAKQPVWRLIKPDQTK